MAEVAEASLCLAQWLRAWKVNIAPLFLIHSLRYSLFLIPYSETDLAA